MGPLATSFLAPDGTATGVSVLFVAPSPPATDSEDDDEGPGFIVRPGAVAEVSFGESPAVVEPIADSAEGEPETGSPTTPVADPGVEGRAAGPEVVGPVSVLDAEGPVVGVTPGVGAREEPEESARPTSAPEIEDTIVVPRSSVASGVVESVALVVASAGDREEPEEVAEAGFVIGFSEGSPTVLSSEVAEGVVFGELPPPLQARRDSSAR